MALLALLLFITGFGLAWQKKELLLAWASEALTLHAFYNPWYPQGTAVPELLPPRQPVAAYLQLATLGGFLLALPIVARQVWAVLSPGSFVSAKISLLYFVLGSYSMLALGLFTSKRVLLPLDLRYLFRPETARPSTELVNEYVGHVSKISLGVSVALQLCVIALVLLRSRRSQPTPPPR